MDKYKKLFSNTIVFAIGTFSSKILTIILTPFITNALNTSEYGVMDIVQQTVNVLVPLATLAVNSAALRFAMDKAEDKRGVFSTGVVVTGIGFGVFLCFTPLISQLTLQDVNIGDYIILIGVFLLSSSTRQLCQQFVRGMGWVRLYAVDGIFATFTNLVCNLLFLGAFKWGVNGAIMAIATSDIISIIFLTAFGRLDRFIRLRRIRWRGAGAMLRYCMPLVPTAILWLIINISDRYMVLGMLGSSANGLYAVASKIPNFVMLFAGIFIDAWQLSAVDEYNTKARGHFFTKIFRVYSGALFAVGSGLILLCQPFTKILVAKDYYESWQYVPILIISTIFSCLVNFLASVYMAEKKNTMSMVTALAGAVLNLGLNFYLIPKIGIFGAAIATLSSFLLVFVLRAVDTKRFIHIRFNPFQIVLNLILLGAQSALMIFWDDISDNQLLLYGVEAGLTLLMLLINGKPLVEIIALLIGKFSKKKCTSPRGKEQQPPRKRAQARTEDDLDIGLERPERYYRPSSPAQGRTESQETKFYDKSAFETLSETIYNGEDYLGLGFDLNDLQKRSDTPSRGEPEYRIQYEDDFAGEYSARNLEPPLRGASKESPHKPVSDQYSGKVKEYLDSDDESYFGENSSGFIRRPGRHNGPQNSPYHKK